MEKEVRYATYKSYVRVFMHDLMPLEGVIAREKKPPTIIGRWFFVLCRALHFYPFSQFSNLNENIR